MKLRFHVNDLETRQEVLAGYLEMNSGGTPHTPEELDKVRAMLELSFRTENQGFKPGVDNNFGM